MKKRVEGSFNFLYAKERYNWEHERKNQLNNMISIPLGIITAIVGFIAYFFNNLPQNRTNLQTFLFYIFFASSIIALINCIRFFYLHQTGYKYAYISDPQDMRNYEDRMKTYYKEQEEKNIDEKIENELNETLYQQYIDGTQKNIHNNEKKIRIYRDLIISVLINIFLLAVTFGIRLNLPNKEEVPITIRTETPLKIEANGSTPITTGNSVNVDLNEPVNIHNDNRIEINGKSKITIESPIDINIKQRKKQ